MRNKIVAPIITLIVIAMLIWAGPAQGFVLNLSLNNDEAYKGDKIEVVTSVDLATTEAIEDIELTFRVSGPESQACKFDHLGNKIEGCEGMTITRTSAPPYVNYGYGYGYGYGSGYIGAGKLSYKITIDTIYYQYGTYSTELEADIDGSVIKKTGEEFLVRARGGSGCSTTYDCTAWSACVDGIQTRTCEPHISYCYAGRLPPLTQSCSGNEAIELSDNVDSALKQPVNLNAPTSNGPDVSMEEIWNNSFGSAITGAVTGAFRNGLSGQNIEFLALTLVIIVLALSFVVLVKAVRYRRATRVMPMKNFYNSQ